jgi:Kelch motif
MSENGPAPRATHHIAFDLATGKILLYGGLEPPDNVFSDTWVWDGKHWAKLLDGGGDGRTHLSMAYDLRCKCPVRFGGKDSKRLPYADTWKFDKGKWVDLGKYGPPARIDHDLVLDSHRKRMVLFGGKTPDPQGVVYGDTWEWDGSSWMRRQ